MSPTRPGTAGEKSGIQYRIVYHQALGNPPQGLPRRLKTKYVMLRLPPARLLLLPRHRPGRDQSPRRRLCSVLPFCRTQPDLRAGHHSPDCLHTRHALWLFAMLFDMRRSAKKAGGIRGDFTLCGIFGLIISENSPLGNSTDQGSRQKACSSCQNPEEKKRPEWPFGRTPGLTHTSVRPPRPVSSRQNSSRRSWTTHSTAPPATRKIHAAGR